MTPQDSVGMLEYLRVVCYDIAVAFLRGEELSGRLESDIRRLGGLGRGDLEPVVRTMYKLTSGGQQETKQEHAAATLSDHIRRVLSSDSELEKKKGAIGMLVDVTRRYINGCRSEVSDTAADATHIFLDSIEKIVKDPAFVPYVQHVAATTAKEEALQPPVAYGTERIVYYTLTDLARFARVDESRVSGFFRAPLKGHGITVKQGTDTIVPIAVENGEHWSTVLFYHFMEKMTRLQNDDAKSFFSGKCAALEEVKARIREKKRDAAIKSKKK